MAKGKSDEDDSSGLFIPAGLFTGMGVGFFIDHLVAGMFAGIGLGFLAMAVVKSRK